MSPATSLAALLAWGVGFGAVSVVPGGAIAVLIIRRTLQAGWRGGAVVLAALLSSEAVHLAIFWFGLGDAIVSKAWVRIPMFLLGGTLLLALGFMTLRRRSDASAELLAHGSFFRQGFLLNMLNPTVVPILAGLIGTARATFGAAIVQEHMLAVLLAQELGVALWFGLTIAVLVRLPEAVVSTLRRRMDRIAGVALCGFGVWLLITTVRELARL